MKVIHFTILVALAGIMPLNGKADDKFGRFFTTPQQRQYLNELRMKQPREELVIDMVDDDIIEENAPEEETAPLDVVRLKGLVHRQGSKESTAWVNDGNTYEGDIGSQYITVTRINSKGVVLDVSGDRMEIELKAGQAYEPANNRIHEVTEQ